MVSTSCNCTRPPTICTSSAHESWRMRNMDTSAPCIVRRSTNERMTKHLSTNLPNWTNDSNRIIECAPLRTNRPIVSNNWFEWSDKINPSKKVRLHVIKFNDFEPSIAFTLIWNPFISIWWMVSEKTLKNRPESTVHRLLSEAICESVGSRCCNRINYRASMVKCAHIKTPSPNALSGDNSDSVLASGERTSCVR